MPRGDKFETLRNRIQVELNRARENFEMADKALYENARPMSENDRRILSSIREGRLRVYNKMWELNDAAEYIKRGLM